MGRVPLHAAFLVCVGVAATGAAYAGVPAMEARFLGPEWQLYQAAGGGLIAALGFVGTVAGLLRREEEAPSVAAHVAFLSKPRPTAGSVVPDPAPARVRAPQAGAAPERTESPMERIEAEIREVTRQINKAGVLLGTGKLSREGYTEYVAELKVKRGALEAERVRLELERQMGRA